MLGWGENSKFKYPSSLRKKGKLNKGGESIPGKTSHKIMHERKEKLGRNINRSLVQRNPNGGTGTETDCI